MRDLISFINYFVRLRINAALGNYHTGNPINLSWRWKHWKHTRHPDR